MGAGHDDSDDIETTPPQSDAEEKSTADIIREQLELDFGDEPEGTPPPLAIEKPPTNDDTPPAKASGDNEGGDGGGKEAQGQDEPPVTIEALQQQLQELQGIKEQYEQLQPVQGFVDFIRDNNLTQGDVRQALELAQLVNVNPRQALEMLKPVVSNLSVASGEALSEEVQRLVDEGEMSEEAALRYQQTVNELAQHRAHYQEQTERQRHYQQQQERYSQQALQQNAIGWEERKRKNDPDYDVPLYQDGPTKGEEVLTELRAMISAQGMPPGLEQQNLMLEQAYKRVNDKINYLKGSQSMRKPVHSGVKHNDGEPPPLILGEASTADIVRRALNLG